VTPVAPYRADIEKNWLVLCAGARKSVMVPLMPINGLVSGGTKIRTG